MRGQALFAAALMSVSVLAAPINASAQPYSSPHPTYHDAHLDQAQCEQDRRNRAATGALIGGAAGVALGSGVASDGRRTEGGVLGGLLGALAGAMIAHGGQCDQVSQNDYDPNSGRRYGNPYGQNPYDDGSGLAGGPGPDDRYGDRKNDQRDCQWRDARGGQPVWMCQGPDGAWRRS